MAAALLVAALPTILCGQGPLTPPGAPAPTMKTLDQIEARTPISSLPFDISVSGSYYLTKNLTGAVGNNGITVTANDVTIDLNGFALRGVAGSLYGIAVGNIKNLSVRNGTVRDWGNSGIAASTGDGARFKALTVTNNCGAGNSDNGFAGMEIGTNGSVSDCVVSNNLRGAGIHTGTNAVVSDCVANNNAGGFGISTGANSVVSKCIANNNSGNPSSGISVATGCVISVCTAQGNQFNGMLLGNSGRVLDCNVGANGQDGIKGGVVVSVSGCVAQGNGASQLNGSAFAGITLGDHGMVERCHSNGNAGLGYEVTNFSVVRDSTADFNVYRGIRVVGSRNRIEGNNLTRNVDGMIVDGTNNVIIRNSTSGNFRFPYIVVAGNIFGPLVTAANLSSSTLGDNYNPNANFDN